MRALKVVENREPEIDEIQCLKSLEKKLLWLSSWMIHNANHLRPSRDGLKVGGHQASSASIVAIMTALYFHVLRPDDRVAVKPHASPVYHAIQYLLGRQTLEKLERYRGLGGAQSYPSRTKDIDDVDFSTGSVGMGVAVTLFSSLVQDYLRLKGMIPNDKARGRMIALVGDAELDEGNVFEALLKGWKHEVRNLWWVIDYNRQSLDQVVSDRLFGRIDDLFEMMGWRVVVLKYGKRLQAAFDKAGGEDLRTWIDECPNSLYSALVFKGGPGWRDQLSRDVNRYPGLRAVLDAHDDESLQALMTNLAGHDIETLVEAFDAITDDLPTCFIAYTIKGFGLPFAGHKDNHAGLMNQAQMEGFQTAMGVPRGGEWDKLDHMSLAPETLQAFLDKVPFAQSGPRRYEAPQIAVPESVAPPREPRMSTQEGFGKILAGLAAGDSELAARIVTTSPDVTVSTNLGPWVNRRGLFSSTEHSDVFREQKVVSAQRWTQSHSGQHVELGIAENNLFLNLAAFGLSGPLFGERLIPVGTLYDPFIQRGLDALYYACYQDARFILTATPSGLTLGPEGGAHQSISTPLIGMGQPGLTSFEPAYVDELSALMRWAFEHVQAEEGGSVYFRLSTRTIDQPDRALGQTTTSDLVAGAYWLKPPGPGTELAILASGALMPEALEAHAQLLEDLPDAGLLAVTSPGRLHSDWREHHEDSHIGQLLGQLSPRAKLVSVIDGHPAAMSWIGAVRGNRIRSLGVDKFGQSGDLPDLYRTYHIDADAILDAAASLLITE